MPLYWRLGTVHFGTEGTYLLSGDKVSVLILSNFGSS